MSQNQGNQAPDNVIVKMVGATVGSTVLGSAIVAAILDPQYRTPILIFLVVALVLALIGIGVFLWWRKHSESKKNKDTEQALRNEFDRQAAANANLDVKGRLEEMKRKFMQLIDELKEQGNKNIYEIPWFLTLGPSGSGKSWVLKGSGLDPLADDRWEGGTHLIDWWKCPEALVLDTAGGVVFSEGGGYDSPEWKSLLKLLKDKRPQCPINGLLVMVPAQLLWLKDEELPERWLTLDQYATALRTQIRQRLERDLGVRFPVYFLVTQTDRLPGFREFADALQANAKSTGQMLGWSLPVDVGRKPLRSSGAGASDPELDEIKIIDQRLRSVAMGLRRQRLGLLAKYVGDGARPDHLGMDVRKRAADLFAFADTIQTTLAPRLQELLGKVFKPDPTLPNLPPYLRGVYFTSALRAGDVLYRSGVTGTMAQLAIPGDTSRTQPNPFFLKDLVSEKAFAEAGLVTPLVQAGAYLKKRRRALMAAGVGAGMLVLLAVGVGGCNYGSTVARELAAWQDAVNGLPVVSGEAGAVQIDRNNLAEQEDLAASASAGLEGGGFWRFRWLFSTAKLDQMRRQAQLRLFEHGVISPMADLTRQGILNATNDPGQFNQKRLDQESRQTEAGLVAVLELELCPNDRAWKDPEWEASRDRVLGGFAAFPLGGQSDDVRSGMLGRLTKLFDATYRARQGDWPPATAKKPLLLPYVIEAGFARIRQLQSRQADLFDERRKLLRSAVGETWNIKNTEAELLSDMDNREASGDLSDVLGNLNANWTTLNTELNANQVQLFMPAFTGYASDVRSAALERQQQLRQQLMQVNGAGSGTNLIPVLQYQFDKLKEDVPEIGEILYQFKDVTNKAAMLDASVLAASVPATGDASSDASPQPAMQQRLALYDQIINLQVSAKRQWQRDLFEDTASDPAQTIQDISGTADQAFPALSQPLFAGLTNESSGYADILRRYVEFRYFEKVLEESKGATERRINDADVELADYRKPGAMLDDTADALRLLNRLEDVWHLLGSKWEDLAAGSTREVKPSLELLDEKKASLFENISGQITKEKDESGKFFPLAREGQPLTESELQRSLSRARLWQDTIANLTADTTKVIPSDIRTEWDHTISQEWLPPLQRLVDENGDIRDYVIRTPWRKDDESAFKDFLKDDAAFQKAQQAAGVYRSWMVGDQSLHADDPNGEIRVNAADGFELLARKDDRQPLESLKTQLRSDSWTVIAMANLDRQSRKPPYFVPIDVQAGGDDQGLARIWFEILPAH